MTTLQQRLARLEDIAQPAGPVRMIVLYPGQEPPEDIGPDDVIIRVVYDDPLTTGEVRE